MRMLLFIKFYTYLGKRPQSVLLDKTEAATYGEICVSPVLWVLVGSEELYVLHLRIPYSGSARFPLKGGRFVTQQEHGWTKNSHSHHYVFSDKLLLAWD